MYSVKGDNVTIYSDNYLTESVAGISPKLTLKDNSAGSFEITLPPGNAGYEKLERLSSEIVVYRDNSEIWSGRIISEKRDFWNNRVLTCEGELAYLNDTTQPPAKFEDLTVRQFLESLLINHNSKVGTDKQFTIGAVTVNETVSRCTNNENTLSAINDHLISYFGGHLRIRKDNGIRYLDYFADWPTTNTQEIRFGQNLIDFTRNWDMTNLATVVMPKGARLDESEIEGLDAYLDVASVNGGSRYVTNEEGVAQFGWIEVVVSWGDITDPNDLLSKAKEYLTNQQFDEMVVEVSAVDLRYLGLTNDSIKLLDEVRCISRPHGMDRIFPVTELSIQLDKPDGSIYTLGSKIQNTLTSTSKDVNSEILNRIDRLDRQPTPQQILQSAKDNASQIINSATRGYVTIVKNSAQTESMVISSDLTYNSNTDLWSNQTRLWRWNIGGLGYSKDGGRTYGTAITMDGSIVADYINTGVLTTVLIQDVNGNSSWNLSTGEFTMKKGTITLGESSSFPDGRFRVNNYGEIYAEYGEIGGFQITSHAIYNDTLNLSAKGLTMKEGGEELGYFGTQYWVGYESHKGITMSLEYNSSPRYIVWANKDNASDDYYTIKLGYSAKQVGPSNGGMKADRIHIGCNVNGNNWLFENSWIDPITGGAKGGLNTTSYYRLGVVNSFGNITGYIEVRFLNGFAMR